METTEIEVLPVITRDQESRLYKFLRERTEGDALRYELVAKKIHRAAEGTALDWELSIVKDWLDAMNELQALADSRKDVPVLREEPFADVRRGQVGNRNYQAFLDTLEQHELDAITNNIPYFAWFSDRRAEMQKSELQGYPYLRLWADQHLSQRVNDLRTHS